MGRDKALLMLEGKPFIQHVAEAMQAVFPEVLISANTPAYDFLNLPIVNDIHLNCGPLGGIHAAMGMAGNAHIFLSPCDMPVLPPAAIQAILGEAMPGYITTACASGRHQPLIGVYPVECRDILGEFLASGERKVADFLSVVQHHIVRLDSIGLRLENINDEGEYRELLRGAPGS